MSPRATPAPLKDLEILLVEDDPSVQRYATAALTYMGAAVTAVDSLTRARAALTQSNVNLAVVDATLPDGNGVAFAADLHRSHPSTAILIVTGLATLSTEELCGFPCLAKPFTLQELMTALDAIA